MLNAFYVSRSALGVLYAVLVFAFGVARLALFNDNLISFPGNRCME
jgi:hypothetical protein